MERFLSQGKLIDLLDSMMNIEDDVEDDFEIPMALEAGVEPAIEVDMIQRH